MRHYHRQTDQWNKISRNKPMVKWFSGTVAMKKKNLQQMVIGKTGYLEAKKCKWTLILPIRINSKWIEDLI